MDVLNFLSDTVECIGGRKTGRLARRRYPVSRNPRTCIIIIRRPYVYDRGDARFGDPREICAKPYDNSHDRRYECNTTVEKHMSTHVLVDEFV